MIAFLGCRPGLLFEVPLVGLCGLDCLKKGCGSFEFLSESVCRSFVDTLTFVRFLIKERVSSAWFCFKSFVIFHYLKFCVIRCNSGVICKVLQVLCKTVFSKQLQTVVSSTVFKPGTLKCSFFSGERNTQMKKKAKILNVSNEYFRSNPLFYREGSKRQFPPEIWCQITVGQI